jgi:hypothetical protein
MKIPKIIHQTWKTNNIPEKCKKWVASWKEKNPDWEYRLWTDEDNRNLIKEYFPKFLKIYDSYSRPIYRADIARYCIVYIHGGVYADLDFECLKPLDKLIKDDSCFFGLEPKEHWNGKHIVCNALFGAVPKTNLFVYFLREIYNRTVRNSSAGKVTRGPVGLTGPKLVTDVLMMKGTKGVKIYRSDVFYPECAKNDSKIQNRMMVIKKGQQKLKNAYATHHWMKSWLKGNKC